MKATARRTARFTHAVSTGAHQLISDEPPEHGGDGAGPSPEQLLAASLAACVAITMEMYAERKGWEIGAVEVEAELTRASREERRRVTIVLRLPAALSDEQVERLRTIASRCPVHRALEGGSVFDERVERIT